MMSVPPMGSERRSSRIGREAMMKSPSGTLMRPSTLSFSVSRADAAGMLLDPAGRVIKDPCVRGAGPESVAVDDLSRSVLHNDDIDAQVLRTVTRENRLREIRGRMPGESVHGGPRGVVLHGPAEVGRPPGRSHRRCAGCPARCTVSPGLRSCHEGVRLTPAK